MTRIHSLRLPLRRRSTGFAPVFWILALFANSPAFGQPEIPFAPDGDRLALLPAQTQENPPESAKSTKPAAPAKAAQTRKTEKLSTGEQIVQLRKELDANTKELESLKKNQSEADTEYEQAEKDLEAVSNKLEKSKQDLGKLKEGADPELHADLQNTVERLTKDRELAKDRFDLVIANRKTLVRQIGTIQNLINWDQQQIEQLSGAAKPRPEADPTPTTATPAPTTTTPPPATNPPTAKPAPGSGPSSGPGANEPAPTATRSDSGTSPNAMPTAPANRPTDAAAPQNPPVPNEPKPAPPANPPAPASTSAQPKNQASAAPTPITNTTTNTAAKPNPVAPVVPLPTPGNIGLPGNATPKADAETNAKAEARPEAPKSDELLQAEKALELKNQALLTAQKNEEVISKRLADLDQSIMLERELLLTAQKSSENSSKARQSANQIFEQRSLAGAPGEELRPLLEKIHEAESRFDSALQDVQRRQERLQNLQETRAQTFRLRANAQRETETLQRDVEQSERLIQNLRNPLALHNIQIWLLNRGPSILIILGGIFTLYGFVAVFSGRIVHLLVKRGNRGTSEERQDRANTLVSVFKNAVNLVIVIGGSMMLLEEIGIPVAPLLGGAAVIGLAVAFGAQNLIRDFFYGFMILLENQYKLNDVVKIGEHSGQVEQITLRMTALRDQEGNRHFIPNGEIKSVINMTHGWSRALFTIGIAYKENVDKVMDVIMRLGQDMRRDPKFGPLILEDPEMLGVDALADSAVIIKFLIKTRPIQQWAVKRELLRRIKNRFDELGIELPFPHRTVYHRMPETETAPKRPLILGIPQDALSGANPQTLANSGTMTMPMTMPIPNTILTSSSSSVIPALAPLILHNGSGSGSGSGGGSNGPQPRNP